MSFIHSFASLALFSRYYRRNHRCRLLLLPRLGTRPPSMILCADDYFPCYTNINNTSLLPKLPSPTVSPPLHVIGNVTLSLDSAWIVIKQTAAAQEAGRQTIVAEKCFPDGARGCLTAGIPVTRTYFRFL